MLKPSVQVIEERGFLVAEFWDCLRLDSAPVQELRRAYESHARRGGKPFVVVDLRGVSFAGSAVLGGFLAMRKQGASLIFCNVEPTVLDVFRVSQILPLFLIANDRDSALKLAEERHAAGTDGVAPGGSRSSDGPPRNPASAAPPPLRRGRKRSDGGGL